MDAWSVPDVAVPHALPASRVEWEWRVLAWGPFAAALPAALVFPPAAVVLLLFHRVALGSWIRAEARQHKLRLPASREQLWMWPWLCLAWYLPYANGWRGAGLLVGWGAWLAAVGGASLAWVVVVASFT